MREAANVCDPQEETGNAVTSHLATAREGLRPVHARRNALDSRIDLDGADEMSEEEEEGAWGEDDVSEGEEQDSNGDDSDDITEMGSRRTLSTSSGGRRSRGGGAHGEQHDEKLCDNIPGLGTFFLRKDKNSRKRRREFVQLGRSQKAKVIKTAYTVIEAVCEVFSPGERMELLDAIVNIHKTYRRKYERRMENEANIAAANVQLRHAKAAEMGAVVNGMFAPGVGELREEDAASITELARGLLASVRPKHMGGGAGALELLSGGAQGGILSHAAGARMGLLGGRHVAPVTAPYGPYVVGSTTSSMLQRIKSEDAAGVWLRSLQPVATQPFVQQQPQQLATSPSAVEDYKGPLSIVAAGEFNPLEQQCKRRKVPEEALILQRMRLNASKGVFPRPTLSDEDPARAPSGGLGDITYGRSLPCLTPAASIVISSSSSTSSSSTVLKQDGNAADRVWFAKV